MEVTLGFLIREFREEKNLSRPQMARRLSISPAYLGHLENDVPTVLSGRLYDVFNNKLGLFIPRKLVEAHNMRAKRYYRSHRQKLES